VKRESWRCVHLKNKDKKKIMLCVHVAIARCSVACHGASSLRSSPSPVESLVCRPRRRRVCSNTSDTDQTQAKSCTWPHSHQNTLPPHKTGTHTADHSSVCRSMALHCCCSTVRSTGCKARRRRRKHLRTHRCRSTRFHHRELRRPLWDFLRKWPTPNPQRSAAWLRCTVGKRMQGSPPRLPRCLCDATASNAIPPLWHLANSPNDNSVCRPTLQSSHRLRLHQEHDVAVAVALGR